VVIRVHLFTTLSLVAAGESTRRQRAKPVITPGPRTRNYAPEPLSETVGNLFEK